MTPRRPDDQPSSGPGTDPADPAMPVAAEPERAPAAAASELVPVPLMGAALGLHPSATVLSDPAPANDVHDDDAARPAPPKSGAKIKRSATQRLAALIRSLFAR